MLISRRRTEMSGTRYNARGIDELGNAANFVETEVILDYQNITVSNVQIRGSCPVLWTQKIKKLKVVLSPVSENSHIESFRAHIRDIAPDYKMLVVLNLLS